MDPPFIIITVIPIAHFHLHATSIGTQGGEMFARVYIGFKAVAKSIINKKGTQAQATLSMERFMLTVVSI